MVLVVKNPPANAGRHKRHRFDPWVGKIPRRRAWQPTLVFSPEGSMDRGAWHAAVHEVTEFDVTELLNCTALNVLIIWESKASDSHI